MESNTQRLKRVIQDIDVPEGLSLVWTEDAQSRRHLFVRADAARDNVTGVITSWQSRKWLLSPYMTDGEIVQTAFACVKMAMEHELRETFLYKGVSVFDPHYDIDKLVELRSQPDALCVREDLRK